MDVVCFQFNCFFCMGVVIIVAEMLIDYRLVCINLSDRSTNKASCILIIIYFQVSQLGAAAQKYQSFTQSAPPNVSVPELQNNCNM